MTVKKLYIATALPSHRVVQLPDGRFVKFRASPYRKIAEADLSPLPAWQPCGSNAAEAPDREYQWYKLERIR